MSVRVFIEMTHETGGTLHVFDHSGQRLVDEHAFELTAEGRLYTNEINAEVEDSCLSVPLSMLDFRQIQLPLSDQRKIRDILPFEMEGLVLGSVDDLVMDAIVLNPLQSREEDAEPRYDILVAYIRKSVLSALLKGLLASGFNPRAVTCMELSGLPEKLAHGGEAGSVALREILTPQVMQPEAAGLPAEPAGDGEHPLPAATTATTAAADTIGRTSRIRAEMSSPTLNFRTGEFIFKRQRGKLKIPALAAITLCVLLTALLCGALILRTMHYKRENARLTQATLQLYEQLVPGSKAESTAGLGYKVSAHLKDLKQRDEFMRGVSPLAFFMRLQETTRPGAHMTDITITPGYTILEGEAQGAVDVQKLSSRLQSIFSEVTVTRTGQNVSGKTAFMITAKENPAAASPSDEAADGGQAQ